MYIYFKYTFIKKVKTAINNFNMKLNYWNKLSDIPHWDQSKELGHGTYNLYWFESKILGQISFKIAKCLTIKEKYVLSALWIKTVQMNKVCGQ